MAFVVQQGGEVNEGLSAGLYATSCALASIAISSPMGFVGGAIYGLTGVLAGRVVTHLCVLNLGVDPNKETLPTATPHEKSRKTLATFALHFGSIAASWAVANALGYSLTFKAVATLTLTSWVIAIPIALVVGTLYITPAIMQALNNPR